MAGGLACRRSRVKRAIDVALAGGAAIAAAPVVVAAAIGIKVSDPGPAFYRSSRSGLDGVPFQILKLRTMRVHQERASQITAQHDDRIFPFGDLLRRTKIDELPQLWNIIVGDMSIVGPRPEAAGIVDDHYGPEHMRTLAVRPGLASPGAIYGYTHGERLLGTDDPERDYLEKLLAVKLGLELAYIDNWSLRYDFSVMVRTIRAIVQVMAGRADLPEPPELAAASTTYLFPVDLERSTDG